jgi:nitroreductase
VAILGPAPPADQLRTLFSLDCDGEPQLLLAWIVDPRQAIARYGARALRLVLQEVGHAAQNVALRLAADGLAGYPLGAVLDREVLALLGLGALDLWVAGGFACGRPATSSG